MPNQQQSTAHRLSQRLPYEANKAEVRYVRQVICNSRVQIHMHGVLA